MTDEAEMTPYSLCDDCPLNYEAPGGCTTGTRFALFQVTGCGKRAEFEKE